MRISRTPGAAVATNSKARASGPMRPTTGTRRKSRRYSRSDASVSIDMAHRRGCTSVGWNFVFPVSRASAIAPLASISQSRVRLPRLAASRASDEATVVLPTPPLPVTTNSLRSSRSRRTPGAADAPSGGTEANPAVLARYAHLNVGHPGRRHPDPPASTVGQPQDAVLATQGRVDVVHQLVAIGVVGHLDLDLLGRVDDTDADVHQRAPLGRRRRWAPGPAMDGPCHRMPERDGRTPEATATPSHGPGKLDAWRRSTRPRRRRARPSGRSAGPRRWTATRAGRPSGGPIATAAPASARWAPCDGTSESTSRT